jgi:hypothetical protein
MVPLGEGDIALSELPVAHGGDTDPQTAEQGEGFSERHRSLAGVFGGRLAGRIGATNEGPLIVVASKTSSGGTS